MRNCWLIEFPGFIKDEEGLAEALKMLSFKSIDDRIVPEIKFHPSSHPIQGRLCEADGGPSSLVININNRNDGNSFDIKVIGEVQRIAQFRRLSDFQQSFSQPAPWTDLLGRLNALSVPENDRLAEEIIASLTAGTEDTCMMPPPPMFIGGANADIPFHFDGGLATTFSRSAYNRRRFWWSLSFAETTNVPTAAPAADATRHAKMPVIERLRRLFQERPIWSRMALRSHLQQQEEDEGISQSDLRNALPCVAYYWSDGPWRCCWVRLGLDPRQEVECRKFQIVECRNKLLSRFPELKASLKSNDRLTYIFDGATLQPSFFQFQLCDLVYEPLAELLATTAPRGTCTVKDGWFPKGTIQQFRRLIKARWLELLQAKHPRVYAEVVTRDEAGDESISENDNKNNNDKSDNDDDEDSYEIYSE